MKTMMRRKPHTSTTLHLITFAVTLWLAAFVGVAGVFAQAKPATKEAAPKTSKEEKIKKKLRQAAIPEDEFGRGTPRDSGPAARAGTRP